MSKKPSFADFQAEGPNEYPDTKADAKPAGAARAAPTKGEEPEPAAGNQRVRVLSRKVAFSSRCDPDLLERFVALSDETGISQVRLLEEGMRATLKNHGK